MSQRVDVPVGLDDPVNARILAVAEDQIAGFRADPFGEIARRSGVDRRVVVERVAAMLEAGTIRRVRQTLLATNLAPGALVAWRVPPARLHAAFDWMFQQDPFSGHVVIRSTDGATAGSAYRLWTTLKVPQGFSVARHCADAAGQVGAEDFRIMPAKCLFVLGVGHVRRRGLEVGSKSAAPAEAVAPEVAELTDLEWRVLTALKREFTVAELQAEDIWAGRAREAGVDRGTFGRLARGLNGRGVIGRFSTFLEHVKPLAGGQRVTRFNALFHWAVAPGRELDAGREIGRFHILTHCYWREGGPEFGGVNLMAVAHGLDKAVLLAHKQAIDAHLAAAGIAVTYTNVFWGGRSEIKPSEISPGAYEAWLRQRGVAVAAMRGA